MAAGKKKKNLLTLLGMTAVLALLVVGYLAASSWTVRMAIRFASAELITILSSSTLTEGTDTELSCSVNNATRG